MSTIILAFYLMIVVVFLAIKIGDLVYEFRQERKEKKPPENN